jgi:hypothetical protein
MQNNAEGGGLDHNDTPAKAPAPPGASYRPRTGPLREWPRWDRRTTPPG